ncbi:hypothetical protein BKA61DRAFT_674103 [Leptodontidium sp. MPI-SDFR-AT-0119]|nr:hypothetical protein BKA61DRAFT_674103 [Leptodontidium sp. MPI-SDFR-AT-0119]
MSYRRRLKRDLLGIQGVLGVSRGEIDIKYSNTKEATLSVWRPRYIRKDGEELEILEAEARVTSQAFRAGDGSFDNLTNVLRLNLDYFATDELSSNR